MTKRKSTATSLAKTSGQDGKPSAVLDGQVPDDHVPATNQCDRLVGRLFAFGAAFVQAFAPDASSAGDGYVVKVFSPDQAIMPMAMTKKR